MSLFPRNRESPYHSPGELHPSSCHGRTLSQCGIVAAAVLAICPVIGKIASALFLSVQRERRTPTIPKLESHPAQELQFARHRAPCSAATSAPNIDDWFLV